MIRANIRKVTPQDRDQIVILYNLDPGVYDWLFKVSAEKPIVGYVAEIDNKIIGAFIMRPYLLKVGDKKIVSYCGGPRIVSECKESWILLELILRIEEELRQLKGVIYGFPNKVTVLHNAKFGAKFVKNLPNYIRIFTLESLNGWKARIRLLPELIYARLKLSLNSSFRRCLGNQDIEIKEICLFDERINNLWEKVAPDYPVILIRDKEYLNWRYIEDPHKQYTIFVAEKDRQVLGYIIFNISYSHESGPRGRIFDLLTIKDDSVILPLLSFTINFLMRQKVGMVEYETSDMYQAQALKKFGFFKSPRARAMFARSDSPEVENSFLLKPGNWFITKGDTLYA